MTDKPTARTRRADDGGYATVGAVRQSGGSLPVYCCNTCNQEVVWATSQRTGRKYLCNVSYGYHHNRYYIGADLHDCQKRLAYLAQCSLDPR